MLCLVFVAGSDSPKRLQPGNGPLHTPATFVASQWTTILRLTFPVFPIGGNHLDAELGELAELGIQTITVLGLVANESLRDIKAERRFKGVVDELDLGWAGTATVDGQRRTASIDHEHDLGAFAFFGGTDVRAPFLAALKVPSINASRRSSRP